MSWARYWATRARVALQLNIRTPLAIRSWLIKVNSWPAAPPTGTATLVAAGAGTAPGAGRPGGWAARGWGGAPPGGAPWGFAPGPAPPLRAAGPPHSAT